MQLNRIFDLCFFCVKVAPSSLRIRTLSSFCDFSCFFCVFFFVVLCFLFESRILQYRKFFLWGGCPVPDFVDGWWHFVTQRPPIQAALTESTVVVAFTNDAYHKIVFFPVYVCRLRMGVGVCQLPSYHVIIWMLLQELSAWVCLTHSKSDPPPRAPCVIISLCFYLPSAGTTADVWASFASPNHGLWCVLERLFKRGKPRRR